MGDNIVLWIHIVAAAAFVGPQIFLSVVMPAVNLLDPPARVKVVRLLTSRFGWLGWGSVAVVVITGIENLRQTAALGVAIFDPDVRYMWVFIAKMALLALALVAVGLHSFVVGPRQIQLMEAAFVAGSNPGGLKAARGATVIFSALGLLTSLGILFLGVLLHDHSFSALPV